MPLGPFDGFDGALDDLGLGHFQLEFAMDGAGRQENMDARLGRILDRRRRSLDVVDVAPGQAADDRPLDLSRDRLHRLEVARRGDRETGLDDIDAQLGQGMGHLELFGEVHAGAGRLLAVTQRGIEDDQLIRGRGKRTHDWHSFGRETMLGYKQKSPGTYWSQGLSSAIKTNLAADDAPRTST